MTITAPMIDRALRELYSDAYITWLISHDQIELAEKRHKMRLILAAALDSAPAGPMAA